MVPRRQFLAMAGDHANHGVIAGKELSLFAEPWAQLQLGLGDLMGPLECADSHFVDPAGNQDFQDCLPKY